jgi:hypothetical protein
VKAFKAYELCPLELKPDANIPDEWPWQVTEIDDEQATEFLDQGYTVLSDVDFASYLATYQGAYDTWSAAYEAQQQTTEAFKKFTITERRQWAEGLMEELKLMNIEAGVDLSQSLWLHHRLRNLTFTVAPGHVTAFPPLAPLLNQTITIDFMNLVISGDIETGFAALVCAAPDDMSQPFHSFSSQLIGFIQMRIAQYLGWS